MPKIPQNFYEDKISSESEMETRKQIKETERFIERFRYKNTKATQVQSRIKMLDKMDTIKTTRNSKTIHFRFPQPLRTGRNVMEMENVKKYYGDLKVHH